MQTREYSRQNSKRAKWILPQEENSNPPAKPKFQFKGSSDVTLKIPKGNDQQWN
jgi:hypothetical protein